MAIWHVFYNSDKEMSWCTNGNITDSIKTEQADAGLSYLEKDTDTTLDCNNFWVNSDGDDVIEKSIFDPTFSTITPALEGVINVTGLPAGTEVFIDNASAGTMSDTTLTLTAAQPGSYTVRFLKTGYKKFSNQKITVKRYGE
jgi:hypothetical protein